jgi:archaellum component FlaC
MDIEAAKQQILPNERFDKVKESLSDIKERIETTYANIERLYKDYHSGWYTDAKSRREVLESLSEKEDKQCTEYGNDLGIINDSVRVIRDILRDLNRDRLI